MSAFLKLGLQHNPFHLLTVAELTSTLIAPALRDEAAGWLADDTKVIEFLGQRGWGKSTHLRVVESIAAERRLSCTWTYIQLGQRSCKWPLPLPQVWFLDEADRLSCSARGRVLSAAAQGRVRVFLGTHVSLVAEGARNGARCRTISLAPADEAAITAFLDVRFRAARSGDAPHGIAPQFDPQAAAALRALSDGSLREVEAILYEAFQSYAADGRLPTRIAESDIQRAARTVQQTTSITAGIADH